MYFQKLLKTAGVQLVLCELAKSKSAVFKVSESIRFDESGLKKSIFGPIFDQKKSEFWKS